MKFVQGYGHHVVLKGRDDLFDPATGEDITTDGGDVVPGLQLFSHNSVTGIPDNVGCCEIVSVGSDVTAVKPGDVVFIDFFDVRQGVLLDSKTPEAGEYYVANDDAFKAKFDPETGTIRALPGYVVTKRANDRMSIALNGTDRVIVPPMTLTQGIVGGRTSDGSPATYVVYEEVVDVGPPGIESKTRPMHRTELALLDEISKWPGGAENVCEYDALHELTNHVRAYLRWREVPRDLDMKVGDLVPFCTDLSVQVRVRGEFMRIVRQDDVLCTIDDRAILDKAIRAGRAGVLQVA